MSSFNREKIKEILMPIVMQAYETKDSNLDIRKNTLDIFSASIDSAIRGISLQEWESQERQRQIQKTLQNQIGELHQKVLGTLEGVSDLGVSQVVDLEGNGFIAEVKNKHNTTKGNHKIAIYDDLADRLANKDENTIAYYVEILPVNGKSYDKPFVPSDNRTRNRRKENPRIRQIDGQSFYTKITGNPNSLNELYWLLPDIINEILREKYGINQNTEDYIDQSEFDNIYNRKSKD